MSDKDPIKDPDDSEDSIKESNGHENPIKKLNNIVDANERKFKEEKLFRVENIHSKDVYLASGKVEKGKHGMATAAEVNTLHKLIKVVGNANNNG